MPVEFKVIAPKTLQVSGDTYYIIITDNNNTIKEVGLFNASSGGNMLLRRILDKSVVMAGNTHLYKIEVEIAVHDV